MPPFLGGALENLIEIATGKTRKSVKNVVRENRCLPCHSCAFQWAHNTVDLPPPTRRRSVRMQEGSCARLRNALRAHEPEGARRARRARSPAARPRWCQRTRSPTARPGWCRAHGHQRTLAERRRRAATGLVRSLRGRQLPREMSWVAAHEGGVRRPPAAGSAHPCRLCASMPAGTQLHAGSAHPCRRVLRGLQCRPR